MARWALRVAVAMLTTVATLTMVAIAAGCTSSTGSPTPTRTAATSGSAMSGSLRLAKYGTPSGFAQNDAKKQPYTVLSLSGICATGPGVKVTGVRLFRSHGLKLVDWGWRVFINGLPGGAGGLATHLGYTHKPIDMPCSSKKHGVAFAVSVERTGSKAGTQRGFTVEYRGGSVDVPFGIALCPATCTDADKRAAGR